MVVNEMFFFHEQSLSKDALLVLDATAKLDTTEFKLFELAYVDWYGEICSGQKMESYFTFYMFDSVVPFWVRAFCRKVLAFKGKQNLVRSSFGIGEVKETREMRILGGLHGAILICCLLLLIYIFSIPANELPEFIKECYFPPCY